MADPPSEKVQERMAILFDLYEAAEEMMRHRLRTAHPEESEEQIEERLVEWLRQSRSVPAVQTTGRPDR